MKSSFINNREVDWKLIRAFVAVMEESTLSAAAERLSATQPTLGRQIRALEVAAGDVLFVRRGLKLEPTENALSLLPWAREIVQDVAALGRAFQTLGEDDTRRKISITAPTLLADEMLPQLLPGLREATPNTCFEIIPSDSVEDLHRRSVDIALRMVRPTQTNLIARKLGTVAVKLFASTGYVEQMGLPQTPDELREHDLILPGNDTQLSIGVARLGLNVDELSVVAVCDDLRNRLALIRAGIGISTCHEWIGKADHELHPILPDIVLADIDLWLVTTDDIQRSRVLRRVFDRLTADVLQRLK